MNSIEAKEALYAGDLEELGRSMIRNTEAQSDLHQDLVGSHHRKTIEIAREFGASGWKVNGAGGEGGSVAILSHPDRARRRETIRAILESDTRYRHIPARLSAWRRRSLFVVCAPCSNSAGHEKRWPAPQLICCTVISWTLH